jgi:hypothetical protein
MECRARTSSEQKAHLAAIAAIVDRWQSGEITLADKREMIARENAFYHGQRQRGRTGKLITADTGEHVHVPSKADEDREQVPDKQDDLWWQEA